MRGLTEEQKKGARKDLAMYLGLPPYDLDEVRRVLASGVLDRLARSKYATAPVDLIRQIAPVPLTERHRNEAIRDLVRVFGATSAREGAHRRRPSPQALDRWFLNRYLRTVRELLLEVGSAGRAARPKRGATP